MTTRFLRMPPRCPEQEKASGTLGPPPDLPWAQPRPARFADTDWDLTPEQIAIFDNPAYIEARQTGIVPPVQPRPGGNKRRRKLRGPGPVVYCEGTEEKPHERAILSPGFALARSGVVWKAKPAPQGIDHWYGDGAHEFRFACGICGQSRRPSEQELAKRIAAGTDIPITSITDRDIGFGAE